MPNAKRDENRITTLLGTSSVDGVTPVRVWADPVTHRLYVDLAGGGGFTNLTATGNVDGDNVTFTFTQKPTYIISDGVWYIENSGWTWLTLTATLGSPPQTGIWGFV